MARVDQIDDGLRVERSVDALAQILDEIKLKDSPDKVVISMSWGVDDLSDISDEMKSYTSAFSDAQVYLIKGLIDTGVVLPVVAVGQDQSADIDTVGQHEYC